MTDAELTRMVEETLIEVAPELEGERFDPNRTFRDQFEIDSMDFLNFIIGLARRTGLSVPESDYPDLQTLAGVVSYLRKHLSPG